jgi:hypothetical protein
MAGARYVVLGLATARSPWFRDVAQWANASSIPVEFVKCMSSEEVRVRLGSGRPFSVLLVDGGLPALDRDLVELAHHRSCAVVVVDDQRASRDWRALGATATLPAGFSRDALLDCLGAHAALIRRSDQVSAEILPDTPSAGLAPLAAVCGPGGTGASTVAIALAQELAGEIGAARAVVLVDAALRAEQAMLHDARDIVPGVQELVDTFRTRQPTAEEVRALTFTVTERQYALLLGLRRPRAWSTIRPRAYAAALAGLRASFGTVVVDTDADVEGEDEGGSIDIEERHTMARTTIGAADAVFVVGHAGMKGMHSMIQVIAELLAFGVPSQRLIPVINRAPRSTRARAQVVSTFDSLMPEWGGAGMPGPVFLPERRVDEALRDGVHLPDALTRPLGAAFHAVLEHADPDARRPDEPQLVTPGTVGHWHAELDPAADY